MLDRKIISSLIKADIPVLVYDELDSTNLEARRIAALGGRQPTLIIARSQSSGRGRLGRSFFSPTGGLYMSLLLYPQIHASDALTITTTAATAVATAIDAIAGTRCEIKWVNDVYLRERKVCGILTESQISESGMLDFAVLGIGVNLVAPEGGFPDDISMRAGAVFDTLPHGAASELTAGIVNEFFRLYDSPHDVCLQKYRERSNLIGREVDVMRVVDGTTTPAKVVAIDDSYALIVEFENGTKEALSSGEVSIREHK